MNDVERCEAYVAARRTLRSIDRAAAQWPAELAVQARAAVRKAVANAAEGAALDAPGARRRCARGALTAACDLAAACDIARALGHVTPQLEDAQRETGTLIALLGLFFKASTY
jgi:hypothetical protein